MNRIVKWSPTHAAIANRFCQVSTLIGILNLGLMVCLSLPESRESPIAKFFTENFISLDFVVYVGLALSIILIVNNRPAWGFNLVAMFPGALYVSAALYMWVFGIPLAEGTKIAPQTAWVFGSWLGIQAVLVVLNGLERLE